MLPPIVEIEDGLRVTHYVDVGAQVRAMGAEERMAPVLEHVLHNHRVTNADVQKMLGVSKPTATRLLQKLESLLEQMGHGAGAYYALIKYKKGSEPIISSELFLFVESFYSRIKLNASEYGIKPP